MELVAYGAEALLRLHQEDFCQMAGQRLLTMRKIRCCAMHAFAQCTAGVVSRRDCRCSGACVTPCI